MDQSRDEVRRSNASGRSPDPVTRFVDWLTFGRLLWTGTLCVVLVSEAGIAAMSVLMLGRIPASNLIAGGVAAFIGSFAALWVLAQIVKELRTGREDLVCQNRELTSAAAKYREVYDGMMDGFAAVDMAGRVVQFNEVFRRTLGYEADELLALTYRDLTPAAWHEFEERILREQVLVRGYSDIYEKEYRRKDGSVFRVELRACLRRDGRGTPTGMWAIVRDVTERVRVEAALRASEQLLRDSQRVAGLGSYVLDMRTGMWRSSDVLDAIFGIDERYVRSVDGWLALIHADFRDDMARYFAERVIGRCERFDREYKIVRRNDGNERWVHGLGELELGGDGQVLRMIGTIHDITGRMEAEEEKRKLEAQLAQAQKMESIGRLAGGVAHDFNNLLTVINGYSGLMLSKLGADDPLQANIAEIHHAGERAAGLTRQLLAFSRKQVLQPRSLNLNHVVKGMVPMLERLMGEDVKIHLALGADSGMVHADPHQLEQVMMNLAVNSRDAMPGCGTLSIETATKVCGEGQTPSHPGLRAGRYAMLAVSDTGVGIDEETRQHIFEPFFTTKEVGKGTGLGLSIIHGIVVQSDGFIEVESEPGRGAAFRIYLPSVEVEAEFAEPEPIAMAANGQKETVLVVEDQEQVRRYALAVLRAQGYKALEAGNADEALAIFEREPVHLLLTDVVMPNLSGRELAARLASRWPVIKVLFMSGYTDDTIVFPSELGEEAHFIQKPFSPEALAGKVRAVLGPLRAAKSAGTLQG